MQLDLEEQVAGVAQNFPYLACVMENSRVQLFVVAERLVLHEASSFIDGLLSLISVYFSFNIEYPKALYSVLIFIQHLVFNVRDTQTVPAAVIRLVSALDNQ